MARGDFGIDLGPGAPAPGRRGVRVRLKVGRRASVVAADDQEGFEPPNRQIRRLVVYGLATALVPPMSVTSLGFS
jgi:hypothetical protein